MSNYAKGLVQEQKVNITLETEIIMVYFDTNRKRVQVVFYSFRGWKV